MIDKELEWLKENSPKLYEECNQKGWVESVMMSYANERLREEGTVRVDEHLNILYKDAAEKAMDSGACRDVVDGLENQYNEAEEITKDELIEKLNRKIATLQSSVDEANGVLRLHDEGSISSINLRQGQEIDEYKEMITEFLSDEVDGSLSYNRVDEIHKLAILKRKFELLQKREELTNNEIMEKMGWTIECESPLEIRHTDGSFANNMPAKEYMRTLIEDYKSGEL